MCSRLPRCRGQVVSEVSTAWPYLSRGFRAHLLQGSGVGHEAVPAGLNGTAEIHPKGVTKEKPVAEMAAAMGFSSEDCVAFGGART